MSSLRGDLNHRIYRMFRVQLVESSTLEVVGEVIQRFTVKLDGSMLTISPTKDIYFPPAKKTYQAAELTIRILDRKGRTMPHLAFPVPFIVPPGVAVGYSRRPGVQSISPKGRLGDE